MPSLGVFPIRENCDPEDPEEAFLWMFAALPGVKGGILVMPIQYYREVSKRLWDLGCRPVEEPTLEWVPPQATDANWITSPGHWVEAGSLPKLTEKDKAKMAMTRMSGQQKAELLAALEGGEPFPDSPSGVVARSLSADQQDTVLTVLREEAGR